MIPYAGRTHGASIYYLIILGFYVMSCIIFLIVTSFCKFQNSLLLLLLLLLVLLLLLLLLLFSFSEFAL